MPRKNSAGAKTKAKNAGRDPYDLLLLGFIFVGLGVGLATGQAGAGLLIGAGAGVLLRGFAKAEPAQIATSLNIAAYILALLGLYIIFLGVALLFNISSFNYPYGAAAPMLIVGLILLLIFAKMRK